MNFCFTNHLTYKCEPLRMELICHCCVACTQKDTHKCFDEHRKNINHFEINSLTDNFYQIDINHCVHNEEVFKETLKNFGGWTIYVGAVVNNNILINSFNMVENGYYEIESGNIFKMIITDEISESNYVAITMKNFIDEIQINSRVKINIDDPNNMTIFRDINDLVLLRGWELKEFKEFKEFKGWCYNFDKNYVIVEQPPIKPALK